MAETDHAPALLHASFLKVGLQVLADRSMKLGVIALSFVLCGAAILRPHWLSLLAAGVFTFLVFPVVWRKEET